LVTPPPAAVTVRVEMPANVVEAAVSVKVSLPLPGAAMLGGAKLAETPAGSPVTDSDIKDLNPVPATVVKVTAIEPPGPTLALVALDDNVKLPRTVRLIV
jgi:hypothetical protein